MKLTRSLQIVVTGLALAAALTSATNAYTTYSSWGTLNVPFYVNPANLDVSASAAISALQAGMGVWNTQSGTSFRFSYAGQSSTTTSSRDGKNVIIFRSGTSGIAATYVWTSGGLLTEADIVFWDGGTKFFTGTSGCSGGAYIEDIAAHELGHALGLQHSNVSSATMYPTYSSCSTGWRTLASDDIAGVRTLYANGPGEADTPPTVSILAPTNGATASSSTSITFSGSATDTTDGNISSDLVWKSNISGQIGSGASFSRTLPAGLHTISATVTDSIGYKITKASMLTVTTGGPSNTAPTVTISSPSNGATVTPGTSVTFTGSANDAQQGNLTGQLVWRSNLAGQIGTGGSFTRVLTAGTHAITATVTDSGGLTTQRVITVYSAAAAPPAPVTGTLTATKRVTPAGVPYAKLIWSGVTSAMVDINRNGTKVSTTTNDGLFSNSIAASGTYVYKVCASGTSTCTNQVSLTF